MKVKLLMRAFLRDYFVVPRHDIVVGANDDDIQEEVLEEVGYTVGALQKIGSAVGAVGISGALQTYYFGEVRFGEGMVVFGTWLWYGYGGFCPQPYPPKTELLHSTIKS